MRRKLAAARGSTDRQHARNAPALEAVQPEEILPGDIDANLGAPWIPEDVVRLFVAELLAVPASAMRAVAALRQAEDVPDQLLAHLSPLGWEHVNLTGDYIWRPATENRDGFRPLRAAPDTARKAARVRGLSAYA